MDILDDLKEIQALLEQQTWKYAKTMPKTPHWYSMRKNWASVDDFMRVNNYIKAHGLTELFKGRVDLVLDVGDYKYWTVWDNTLINRAWIGDKHGTPTPPEYVEILAKKDPAAYL